MPALPTAQALTSQLAAMYRQPSPMLPSRLTLRTGRPLAGTAVWNWTAGLVTTAVWIWAASLAMGLSRPAELTAVPRPMPAA